MTFVADTGTGLPVSDYSSRDFASIYADLLNRISAFLPEWTSQSPNDFGIVLLQMFAYMGDILGYYEDRIAGEAFLQTATQPQSILNLAAMLDYTPSGSVGSFVNLTITISNTIVGPYTIAAGTQFATQSTPSQSAIIFETSKALVIAGTGGATPSQTGTVAATQGQTINSATTSSLSGTVVTPMPVSLGTSNGTVNQSFQLLQSPVIQGSIQLSVDLGQGPVLWTEVPQLINYGPGAQVYTTFTAPNNITFIVFGDNVNGYVPPLGSPITVLYRVGVGAAGNVPAGTITQPVTALFGVTAVTNPAAASGGADPQSLTSIATNAPIALRSLNRAVTVADFSTLALQSAAGIQWASAQELTYQLVNLYICPVGFTGGALPSGLISAVQNGMTPLVMANTTFVVLPATFVGINVTLQLVVLPSYGNTVTQLAVQNAIAEMLNIDETGFGFRVSVGMMYETILTVPGVNYAIVSNMYRAVLCTLTAPLTNGTMYTALTVSQLPQAVTAGDTITVQNLTDNNTQSLVASANASAGAVSISVNSFTANDNYPIGSTVQDSTGVRDCVFLVNEIPIFGTVAFNPATSGGLAGS